MRSIYTSQVIDQNVVLESIALENISLGYSHHVLPLCIIEEKVICYQFEVGK